MNALQLQDHIIKRPIQEGDCGVILRKEGGFDLFSTGSVDPDQLTVIQMEHGLIMTALAILLRAPETRTMLIKLASDPEIVGEDPFGVDRKH